MGRKILQFSLELLFAIVVVAIFFKLVGIISLHWIFLAKWINVITIIFLIFMFLLFLYKKPGGKDGCW